MTNYRLRRWTILMLLGASLLAGCSPKHSWTVVKEAAQELVVPEPARAKNSKKSKTLKTSKKSKKSKTLKLVRGPSLADRRAQSEANKVLGKQRRRMLKSVVQECHDAMQSELRTPNDEMHMRIDVAPSGRVERAIVTESNLVDEAVERCAIEGALRLRMPRHSAVKMKVIHHQGFYLGPGSRPFDGSNCLIGVSFNMETGESRCVQEGDESRAPLQRAEVKRTIKEQ